MAESRLVAVGHWRPRELQLSVCVWHLTGMLGALGLSLHTKTGETFRCTAVGVQGAFGLWVGPLKAPYKPKIVTFAIAPLSCFHLTSHFLKEGSFSSPRRQGSHSAPSQCCPRAHTHTHGLSLMPPPLIITIISGNEGMSTREWAVTI